MNKEEIKEILNRLDYNEWEVDLYKVPITWCELYDIRDYITNLQEEHNSWKRVATKNFNDAEDYKLIINKALEYIEKYIIGNKLENVDWEFDDCNFSDMPVERIKPLIGILKGEE